MFILRACFSKSVPILMLMNVEWNQPGGRWQYFKGKCIQNINNSLQLENCGGCTTNHIYPKSSWIFRTSWYCGYLKKRLRYNRLPGILSFTTSRGLNLRNYITISCSKVGLIPLMHVPYYSRCHDISRNIIDHFVKYVMTKRHLQWLSNCGI